MLTTVALVSILPTINAQEADTYCDIIVSPNPVGVGQTAFVVFWTTVYPPTARGSGGDRWTFTVEITQPDGSTETKGPITSDPVGGGYIVFIPDQVGTYSFQATFPGKTLEASENPFPAGLPYVGTYFKPSTSKKLELTVQQDPITEWPVWISRQTTGNALYHQNLKNGLQYQEAGLWQHPIIECQIESTIHILRLLQPLI